MARPVLSRRDAGLLPVPDVSRHTLARPVTPVSAMTSSDGGHPNAERDEDRKCDSDTRSSSDADSDSDAGSDIDSEASPATIPVHTHDTDTPLSTAPPTAALSRNSSGLSAYCSPSPQSAVANSDGFKTTQSKCLRWTDPKFSAERLTFHPSALSTSTKAGSTCSVPECMGKQMTVLYNQGNYSVLRPTCWSIGTTTTPGEEDGMISLGTAVRGEVARRGGSNVEPADLVSYRSKDFEDAVMRVAESVRKPVVFMTRQQ